LPVAFANAENDLLMKLSYEFHKVRWLYSMGEVDKLTIFWCEIFLGLFVPKLLKLVSI